MPMWFFVDANHLPKYGGVYINMLSTGGWLCMLNGCCVAWKSRRQPLFADSTCVAEYMAAADAAKMAIHMRLMLDDFGIPQTQPTTIMEDNMSCCKIAEKPCEHKRTLHIDCRAHLLRQYNQYGEIAMQHVRTTEQPADSMTKNLPEPQVRRYRNWVLRGQINSAG